MFASKDNFMVNVALCHFVPDHKKHLGKKVNEVAQPQLGSGATKGQQSLQI